MTIGKYGESKGEISKDRFESYIMPITETGCWIWMGTAEKRKNGYGRIQPAKTRISMQTHRVSWEIYKGKIPQDKFVLHKCDIGLCVNPDHLYLGSQKENMRDKFYRGRDNIKRYDYSCPKGHIRTEKNTKIYKNRRYCKDCQEIKIARYKQEGRYKSTGKYGLARKLKEKIH